MFEDKTEQEARQEILALVEEYAERFREKKRDFHPGDHISYASRVYDHKEMVLSLIHISEPTRPY